MKEQKCAIHLSLKNSFTSRQLSRKTSLGPHDGEPVVSQWRGRSWSRELGHLRGPHLPGPAPWSQTVLQPCCYRKRPAHTPCTLKAGQGLFPNNPSIPSALSPSCVHVRPCAHSSKPWGGGTVPTGRCGGEGCGTHQSRAEAKVSWSRSGQGGCCRTWVACCRSSP